MQHTCYSSLVKWDFPNLSAPIWRWYHNDRPGASIIVDKKHIPLDPGSIFLIPPYVAFTSKTKNPFRQLYMHFTLGSKRTPLSGAVFSHKVKPEEKRRIQQLIHALEEGAVKAEVKISILSQTLVQMALEEIPENSWNEELPDPRIATAIEILNTSPLVSTGNRALARRVGMNVNAFTRLFKKATGHTPHQYLLRLRMEAACQLLQHGDASLEAIAEQTGFCDRFHFSRIFKQHYRTGPAAFRRRALGR